MNIMYNNTKYKNFKLRYIFSIYKICVMLAKWIFSKIDFEKTFGNINKNNIRNFMV